MKKNLLFFLALAGMTLSGSAAQVERELTVDFTADNVTEVTGLTVQSGNIGLSGMYGLTSPITVQKEINFTTSNFDFKFQALDADGVPSESAEGGFALVKTTSTNATNANAKGMCINGAFFTSYKARTIPLITISAPTGCEINNVTIYIAGSQQGSWDMNINGNVVDAQDVNSGTATFEYYSQALKPAVDQVLIKYEPNDGTYPNSYMRFIHKVVINYTEDAGDKQPAGLGLTLDGSNAAGKTLTAMMGRDFNQPVLVNPHDLPVVWSSSDENIATVDAEGNVTFVGGGEVKITASFAGDDAYMSDEVYYNVSVTGSASNALQLAEFAPNYQDKVYVDFPMTVTFCKGSAAFVVDAEGNAAQIMNTANLGSTSTGSADNVYKVGDVIPAGWMAVNYSRYETVWGGTPADPTETVAVEYPKVESLNYKNDANKVVILQNVPFSPMTLASGGDIVEKKYISVNGETYEFQNTYNVAEEPGGSYDVTLVVRYTVVNGKTYAWLAPIAYEALPREIPDEIDATATNSLAVSSVAADGVYTVTVVRSGESEVVVTLNTELNTSDWQGYVGGVNKPAEDEEAATPSTVAQAASDKIVWGNMDTYVSGLGYEKSNTITFPYDAEQAEMTGTFYMYTGSFVNTSNPINVIVKNAPEYPEAFDVTVNEGLTVEQGIDDETGYYSITVTGSTFDENVEVTLQTPEGWDGFYILNYAEMGGGHQWSSVKKALAADAWVDADAMEAEGWKKTNTVAIPVGADMPMAGVMLYVGDKVYTGENLVIQSQVVAEEPIAFEDAVKLDFPAKNEFSLDESFGMAQQGVPFGMAIIQLAAADGVSVNSSSDAKVQLYYGDKLIKEIGTAEPDDEGDGTGIAASGFSFSADDVEWPSTNTYMLVFSTEPTEEFTQQGEYTVKIPQGVFVKDKEQVAAGEINYTLVGAKERAYTITPEPGSEIYGALPSISIVVEDCVLIDYDKNPAKLYNPDGKVLSMPMPRLEVTTGRNHNKLTWTPAASIDWINGTYKFVISAETIALNGSVDDGVECTFPAEDIVALYVVNSGSDGVALVGLDEADDYSVYTVDGKVVLLNAPAEKLVELESGLYIINGAKVKVVK